MMETPSQKPEATKPLPMRKDLAPELFEGTDLPPDRNIRDTMGGKLTHLFTHYGIGWVANSTMSLVFTYFLNPRPAVKRFKEAATEGIVKMLAGADQKKTLDSVRSTVEILFMTIAGTVVTLVMTPLVKNHERVSHWLNKKFFPKDAEVLPDAMKPVKEARCLEEQIEQQINKRVNKKYTGFDLWAARLVTLIGVVAGDFGLNRLSRRLEAGGMQSIDTLSWRAGFKLYDLLPKGSVRWMNQKFTKYGAGIDDMRANMKDHFQNLEKNEAKYAPGAPNDDRKVISEQTRIIGKEWGWTLILAGFVDTLINSVRGARIHWQRNKAIRELRGEGLIPENYRVVFDEALTLQRITPATSPEAEPVAETSWSAGQAPRAKPTKSESHSASAKASRLASEQWVGSGSF